MYNLEKVQEEILKQKIWMNEKDNVYEYVYYIFNVILNKYKIKEDFTWL